MISKYEDEIKLNFLEISLIMWWIYSSISTCQQQVDELYKGYSCLQVIVWVHFVCWGMIHGKYMVRQGGVIENPPSHVSKEN